MSTFTPARELAEGFHADVIRPLLDGTPYASGLLGWGSDVLGYDTERSTDHGWGPRLAIFVDADQVEAVKSAVDKGIPDEYRGHSVRFGWDTYAPTHHITVSTLGDWLTDHLGVDASRGMTTRDWLMVPQMRLLGVVAGRVYADDGRLQPVRDALAWYPDDVWRWLLACQWQRLEQEEPFVQRTAEVGDHLGSAVVAARLVRDVMGLALLMARTYAPYSKWFGTAFAGLDHSDGLDKVLHQAVTAQNLQDREQALTRAYELVARRHNALGITEPLDSSVRPFHDRPALVLAAARFMEACLATVQDPQLKKLKLFGSVEQFSDNTDLLSNPRAYTRLAQLYETGNQ